MARETNELLNMVRELKQRIQSLSRDGGRVPPEATVSAEDQGIPCDMVETEGAFHLTLDLPGAKPEDVHLSVEGRRLKIAVGGQPVPVEEELHAVMVERRGGKMTRSIELPADVDGKSLQMEFLSGVLSVKLKKMPGRGG